MSKQYPGGLITKSPVTPSGAYENSTASGIWTLDQQAYWRKLNQWPIAGSVQPDPQFNYVTMLLHGDGTNGAQNNTFLDSSGNNYTITRSGNTTQGSFGPYGSNWSNYFDGSGDRLGVANNSVFYLLTNSFTIEYWVYLDGALPSGEIPFIFGNVNTASGGGGYVFYINDSRQPVFYYTTGGTFPGIAKTSSIAIPLNTWTHVAISRSGNNWNIFVNGVSGLSTTDTNQVFSSTNAFAIGGDYLGNTGVQLKGYLSNLRVVVGTAVYTSNFTPPTAPLTAITNTVLLTCADNRFIDDSTNNFAITVTGNVNVQRFNPFGTATAYSTSVIGGSGYFDKTGDYLTMPANTATTLGTGDFTVECWVYGLGTGDYRRAFWFQYNSTNNNSGLSVERYTDTGGTTLYALNYSTGQITNTNARGGIYAWNHIAVTRSSGTIRFFINGISQGSAADTGNYTIGTAPLIGNAYEGGSLKTDAWDGYICDFRLVKGTALYTSGFTPPTAPLTAVSGTSILASMTNGAIFDNAMMNDLETVGNAQISTSVVKYGTGSLAFDGTGDRLVGPATPNMAFGTGDYTIEFWCYPSNTGYGCFIDTRSANPSTDGIAIFNNGTSLEIYSQGQVLTASSAFTLNTWQFFALARSGTTLKAFVNGTQVGSTVTNSDNQTAGRVMIGDNVQALYSLNGYIDDLRITKGYARYTANFTPPTAAFPNIGPT